MKRFNKNIFNFFFVLLFSLMLTACSGLSDGVVLNIKNMPRQIEKQHELIATKKAAYENLSSDQEWLFIKPYLEKEAWANSFAKANDSIALATARYQSQIIPLMERDEPEDDAAARVLIAKFASEMAASRAAALIPEQRFSFLIKVRETASAINEQSKVDSKQLTKLTNQLSKRARKAASDYAHKKEDISSRLSALNVLADKGAASEKLLNQQFRKTKDDIDYAVFGDEAVNLSKTLAETVDFHKLTNSKFDELYKSYTKVLADQRIEYMVIIGRASWCEGEYCGNGTTRHYPAVMVDEKVYEYLEALQQDRIASLSSNWGRESFKINVSNPVWNALRIDKKWNWPRSDDYAEYWLEKTYTNSYHRYVEVVNDKMTKGDWVRVEEDDFWQQYNNLGMAILTKPYGYYEEDALKDAQPVGMAAIATPVMKNNIATGSNQYGEWRQQNGQSFWYYYGMYRLFGDLTGRSRYSYNDWNGYSSHRRGGAYYGRGNEYGTWGSSTYKNRRYRDSDFATRNPADVQAARSGKSRRSSRMTSSIRGAGTSSRSRGPSGGGK